MKKTYIDIDVASQTNQKGGLISLVECDILQNLATDKVCLELGSYSGMSTVALAEVAKEVTAVDTFKATSNGQTQVAEFTTLNLFKENTDGYDNIVVKVGKTSDVVPTLPDDYFDLVFIDAMHDVKSVENDLLMSWPKLKMGGLVVFHDYGWDAFNHDGGPRVAIDKYFSKIVLTASSIVYRDKDSELLEPLKSDGEPFTEITITEPVLNVTNVDKYMCLGCGRFWEVDKSMFKEGYGNFHCPYCWDVYYTGNIITGKPPDVFPITVIKSCCGEIKSDTPSDLRFCVCGKPLDVELPVNMGITDWQKSELERIGI